MDQIEENSESQSKGPPIESSSKKKLTTYDDHFKTFSDKVPIKDKIKYLCLQEQNNYFIDTPISSMAHIDVNIRPVKEVPINFRSLNKWKCQMNKKLNFVWSNIDEPYCQEFKQQVDKFTSVSKAYSVATKINKEQNPEYKSNQSTSIGFSERKKSSAICPVSVASSSGLSTASSSNHSNQDLIAIFKMESILELEESFDIIQQLCVMKKEDLSKKINDGKQKESFIWAKDL